MKITRELCGEEGNFQDRSLEVKFLWSPEETEQVPPAVRNAVEAVVMIMGYCFADNVEYAFNLDGAGRPCLTQSAHQYLSHGLVLSSVLKYVWREILESVRQDFDAMEPHHTLDNSGSKRIFLRRLELVDALLRINFYHNNYWHYRANWTRAQFLNEAHEPNEVFGFPFAKTS